MLLKFCVHSLFLSFWGVVNSGGFFVSSMYVLVLRQMFLVVCRDIFFAALPHRLLTVPKWSHNSVSKKCNSFQDFHFLLQDPRTPEGFQKGFRRGL